MASMIPWKGTFNINNEVFDPSAHALTKGQAKFKMVKEIAEKKGVMPVVIYGYLKSHPHSFEIRKVESVK